MEKNDKRQSDWQAQPKQRPLPAQNPTRDVKIQGQPKEKPAPTNLPQKK
jgi:hypothetical protein